MRARKLAALAALLLMASVAYAAIGTGPIIVNALQLDGPAANISTPMAPDDNYSRFTNTKPQETKWARVRVVAAIADSINAVWSVRFYGSFDGTNYAPILRNQGSSATTEHAQLQSRTPADTLKIRGRGRMALYNNANGWWFPLTSDQGVPIPHKYIIAVCSVDTTAAATGLVTFTVEIR